jgi:hypothetical protein
VSWYRLVEIVDIVLTEREQHEIRLHYQPFAKKMLLINYRGPPNASVDDFDGHPRAHERLTEQVRKRVLIVYKIPERKRIS